MSKCLQALVVLAFVCVVAGGCGPRSRRTIEAKGAVTIDGTPVQVGQIAFDIVAEGDLPSGGAITSGTYRVMTTPGRKKVRVTALDPQSLSQGGNDGIKPDAKAPMAKDLVPAKYQKEPLEIEITASGVYDIKLTSD